MAGRKEHSPESPGAPGWYPDPWSATGFGERYFDGERWGSSERPLARHSVDPEPVRPTARPGRARRSRSAWRPVVAFVLLFAMVWGYQASQRSTSSTPSAQPGITHSTVSRLTERPPPSQEEASQPLGTPAAAPKGHGKFEFVRSQPGDPTTPVAFDPCRPVHYVVNLKGAPSDGLSLIKRAVARVQTATGLRFEYDGKTTEAPAKDRPPYQPNRYGKRWAPVLIAWRSADEYPTLSGYVAGVGGAQAVSINAGQLVNVTGELVLDREQLSEESTSDRGEVRAIILHELGHVVGLDHTSDQSQLMFSEARFNVRDFGDGDLRGLHILGTQQCFPDV